MTIPVHILTGFLGSGKTTLLNRLLATASLSNSAVIVNEYGAIGIDHHLVEQSDDRFVELAGGCVCCAVRGDLAATLAQLLDARAAGRCSAFTQVLIETTGLADPNPIVNLLGVDRDLAERTHLGATLATVDAVNGVTSLTQFVEATQQVVLADTVVITKTDLAAEATNVIELARTTNPHAQMVTAGINDELPAIELLLRRQTVASTRRSHEHHQHTADIESFVVQRDTPIHPAVIPLFVEALAQQLGTALLRLKGIISLDGQDVRVVLHAAQHVFHPLASLPDGADESFGGSELVFIVRGEAQAFVESLLDTISAEVADTLAHQRRD